jgi:hypothetical protein
MNHIYEVSSAQLDRVVEFINENWQAVSEIPLITNAERQKSYWDEVHQMGRIFYYRGENGSISALLVLTLKNVVVNIDLLFIKPELKNQNIETTLLSFAEKAAVKWSGEYIQLMFSGREELNLFFPKFQELGYAFQCPIKQKGNVLLEKKLN